MAASARLGAALSTAAAPLRVLLVEQDLHDNGAVRVSLDRAGRWAAAGAVVTLLVVDVAGVSPDIAVPPGVRLVGATSGPARARRHLPRALVAAVRLAHACDVVVSGREVTLGLVIAALASRAARRPLAVTVQSQVDAALAEYVPPHLRRATRWTLQRCDLAVCVSPGLEPSLAAAGVHAARIRTVENGVDAVAVRRAAQAASPVPLPPGPVIVAVGRLVRQKGLDVLLRADALARAQGAPDHSLLLLGEGPERPALQALTAELGLQDRVALPGSVDNPHAAVARCDLLVLASRWEGFGLVLAEALVLGLPVVAADCPAGPATVLDGGRLGRLVPPEDVPALATALREHLEDPQDLRSRAAEGAAVVPTRFDAGRAAARHLDLLTDLVGDRPVRA